jgi:transketolase
VAARTELEAEGIATAVVSMPCWELFEQQEPSYRRSVLGQGVRVGVEAAVRQGWDAYLGTEGGFIGMRGFGASGPAEALYRLFGITAEAVAQQAREILAGQSMPQSTP